VYFNFVTVYLNFGAIYLNFGAIYLNFGAAMYLNFGDKIEIRVFSKAVWGGWVGPPGPPGGLGIGVGKKYSAHQPAAPRPETKGGMHFIFLLYYHPYFCLFVTPVRDRFLGSKWLIRCSPSS